MEQQPPKYALKFLRWFCRDDYIEEIEGNLYELFELEQETSIGKAKRNFYWNVLTHFRPEYIRAIARITQLINYGMLTNYLKIAWRSILKQKLYSFINIGGLAIGLTCFILIFLYIQHELSYDRFYPNADRIHRIYWKAQSLPYLGSDKYAYTTVGLAPTLDDEYPEVSKATTIREAEALLSKEDRHFYETGIWADAAFFEVFSIPFVHGDPQTALSTKASIVICQSLAEKFFGQDDPTGQSLVFRDGPVYVITGVMEDLPTTSTLRFSFVSSIQSMGQYAREIKENPWNNNDYHTFLSLQEGSNLAALEQKLPDLLEKYWDAEHLAQYPFSLHVQALSELHFEDRVNFDIGLKGNSKYISLFSLIAILVLLLACANYMSLAIARSIKRASEVGLRKVIGAQRIQLLGQFLGESILIAFLALAIALGLTYLLTPFFGHMLDRPIEFNPIENPLLLPALCLLAITVGLISGSYPAFSMSSLRPIQVLKGKAQGRIAGFQIQRYLMIGQYTISIVLIISSLVIYQQFQFIQDRELGYNKEQVLTISVLDSRIGEHLEELKREWLRKPEIESVTSTWELPTNVTSSTKIRHAHETQNDGFPIYRARVDHGYLDVFGLELISGRDFDPNIQSDSAEARIINETAAKTLGWTPDEAIGKPIKEISERKVIGVVKDFHLHSMHNAIAPMMLMMNGGNRSAFIALKVRPENLTKTIAFVEQSISQHTPYPFQYQFLDERFDALYKADLRLGEMFGFFTLLSIFIASLGLFGLAAFVAGQRTKEIGIRKVLGASISSIVSLLTKDFLLLVGIGFLIAVPIAWYGMNQWLQDFAYRINLQWWMFALAGLAAISIAFFTVGSQSLKAALSNPVEALKND